MPVAPAVAVLVPVPAKYATLQPASRMNSWLYVRNVDSVLIVEVSSSELHVLGPGPQRVRVRFDRAEELFAYRQECANSLTAASFRSLGYNVDRRRSPDRRNAARAGRDRRG